MRRIESSATQTDSTSEKSLPCRADGALHGSGYYDYCEVPNRDQHFITE